MTFQILIELTWSYSHFLVIVKPSFVFMTPSGRPQNSFREHPYIVL